MPEMRAQTKDEDKVTTNDLQQLRREDQGITMNSQKKATGTLTIEPPKFKTATFHIVGTAPYVQHKFSAKAKAIMRAAQEAGSTGKKGKKREGKDFKQNYKEALHVSEEGWYGIPAPAFRAAMISACRVVGFQMTKAKLSVFVEADGFDAEDSTPLVRITKGEPAYFESLVRNETGVADIRARPKWAAGWEAKVRVTYDGDQFTDADTYNLLMRCGLQVGIGEGRPDSKRSTGMGWGTFTIVQ